MLPIEPRLKPLGATILHYADGETKTEFKRCHSYSGYIPYDLNDADAKSDASVEDAYEDVTTVVWPGTDEEHEAPSQSFNAQVSVPQPASIGEKVIMGFGRALRKAVRDTCTAHPGRCGTFETLDSHVDLEEFIWCLHKTAGAPPVCFVYAFVYICRMSESQMEELSPRTVHRLLLAALTIAAKMQQPQSFDINLYAQAGNVTASELQHLETQFLELLQWNVEVCAKSFRRIFRLLSQAAA